MALGTPCSLPIYPIALDPLLGGLAFQRSSSGVLPFKATLAETNTTSLTIGNSMRHRDRIVRRAPDASPTLLHLMASLISRDMAVYMPRKNDFTSNHPCVRNKPRITQGGEPGAERSTATQLKCYLLLWSIVGSTKVTRFATLGSSSGASKLFLVINRLLMSKPKEFSVPARISAAVWTWCQVPLSPKIHSHISDNSHMHTSIDTTYLLYSLPKWKPQTCRQKKIS